MNEAIDVNVINRDYFLGLVLGKATNQNYSEGRLYTIRKLAENAKKMRIGADDKALVLLGSNVYTVTYDVFTEAVKECFEQRLERVDNTKLDSKLYIEELDIKDKLIGKL